VHRVGRTARAGEYVRQFMLQCVHGTVSFLLCSIIQHCLYSFSVTLFHFSLSLSQSTSFFLSCSHSFLHSFLHSLYHSFHSHLFVILFLVFFCCYSSSSTFYSFNTTSAASSQFPSSFYLPFLFSNSSSSPSSPLTRLLSSPSFLCSQPFSSPLHMQVAEAVLCCSSRRKKSPTCPSSWDAVSLSLRSIRYPYNSYISSFLSIHHLVPTLTSPHLLFPILTF
jgi:hypothetical protein